MGWDEAEETEEAAVEEEGMGDSDVGRRPGLERKRGTSGRG